MTSHFYLIFFCYTMLHAKSCIDPTETYQEHGTNHADLSNKNNARKGLKLKPKPLLKDRVNQTKIIQSDTSEKPLVQTQGVNSTQGMPGQYDGLYTHSTEKHQPYKPLENLENQIETKQSCPSLNAQDVILTKEMLDQVKKALETEALHWHIKRIELSTQDLCSLQGQNWLNDNIIEAYMCMIDKRSKEKVYSFNTRFYQKLLAPNYTYENIKNWTKNIDIFSYNIVLVPIHLVNHWCLAVIDFRKKAIEYYDSLGGANKGCLRRLLNYLIAEMASKKNGVIKKEEWRLECLKNIPQQENRYDCGVFVCKFADYVSRDVPINFTQRDMPYFRKRMAIEILQGALM